LVFIEERSPSTSVLGSVKFSANEFGVAADRIDGLALPPFRGAAGVVFYLDVPAEIITRRSGSRRARPRRHRRRLICKRVEVGTVRHVVVGLSSPRIRSPPELDEFVGTGCRPGKGCSAPRGTWRLYIREQMFRNDGAGGADKGIGPERRRLLEQDADRESSTFSTVMSR